MQASQASTFCLKIYINHINMIFYGDLSNVNASHEVKLYCLF